MRKEQSCRLREEVFINSWGKRKAERGTKLVGPGREKLMEISQAAQSCFSSTQKAGTLLPPNFWELPNSRNKRRIGHPRSLRG